MEKKEIALEGPRTVGETRVYVTTETWISCIDNHGRLVCSAVRRPTYVVIVSNTEERAFTADGEEIAIERVAEQLRGAGLELPFFSPG